MSQDARRDEELATSRRAQILGLEYIDTQNPDKKLYPEILPVDKLKELRVIPIYSDSSHIQFGVTNTTSQQTMSGLRNQFLDQRITFGLISDTGYKEYINLYDPPKKVVYQDININQQTQSQIESISSTLETVRGDDILAYLVSQAHKLSASDIHIETEKDYVRIRFRIDGVLHPVAKLTPVKYKVLLSVVASAGNISTSDPNAQQGHISQSVTMQTGEAVQVNLRLEAIPTINGIDLVMRLFNLNQEMYNLDRLGLSDKERTIVDQIINKPSGLVLIVGPTGSGKTTTLYSMLNSLNTEQRKIITIEDPVEYQFSGITQISVTTQNSQSQNFAEKLRAVLRLDPDIVMVGEVRDTDTAKTALQASLTGHLVLSTFHASSAAAALTRLSDIIGQNPLFMSAIRLVMAQRLVRKLDDSSKQEYTPDENILSKIKSVLDTLPGNVDKPDLNNIRLYKPTPTTENPYGYSGQIALREQLEISPSIRNLLSSSGTVGTNEIEKAAVTDGMVTMLQNGILKAIAGETTLEEVYRVLG